MHRFTAGLITLFVCLFIWAAAGAQHAAAGSRAASDPVAVVGGVPIPYSDLDWEMRSLMAKGLPMHGGEEEIDSIKALVLDDLIERELLYQNGVKAGFSVDSELVRDQVGMLRDRFPDAEVFESALSEMDMSVQDLERHIERGMLIKKYVEEAFVDKMDITEQALEDFYRDNSEVFARPEQVRARHILREVDFDGSADEIQQEREFVDSLRARIDGGEDFGDIARENSTCPSSSQDGDLGFFGRGEMVPEFEDAAFALEAGEVSGTVETMFGFHLIQVLEKQEEGMVPFDEIKDRISDHLKQEKGKEAVAARLEELKETVTITRMLE